MDPLIIILAAVVVVSLGLSLTMLFLQMRRNKSGGQTPIGKAKANQQPPAPPPAGNAYPPYPPQPPQQPPQRPAYPGQWGPPSGPGAGTHTEPLFVPGQQSFSSPGGGTERLMNDAFSIYIRETSPDNVRDYEVIVRGELSVGRSATSGLRIDNPTVSGTQCTLIAGPECVFVSNKSNSNITRLNGAKLEEIRPIKPGDTLMFGRVSVYLMGINKYAPR